MLLESHGELIYKKDLQAVMEGAASPHVGLVWDIRYVDGHERAAGGSVCHAEALYKAYPHQGFNNYQWQGGVRSAWNGHCADISGH